MTLRKILTAPMWCIPIFVFVACWALITDIILKYTGFIFLPTVAYLDYHAQPLRWLIIIPWYAAASCVAILGTIKLMEISVAVGELNNDPRAEPTP